jgi:hypothetical protein
MGTAYTITYTTDQGWIGQITKYSQHDAEIVATSLLGHLMARGIICHTRIIHNDTIINEWEY